MMKALKAEKVQTLTSRETHITQALKAYIKLKDTLLPVLLDTDASVSAILKDLVQKLQLKVEANDRIKVVDLIKKASLLVQHIRISEILYIVEGTETILILDTD